MMKESGRLIFDSSSSSSSSAALHGNLLLLGGAGGGLGFHGGGRSVLGMDEIGGGKRRPFFTSPEYLMMEDEYYDEQMLPEKKRRLTSEQVQFLEKSFEVENKLEPERKGELAKKLGLQPRQVAVWFQNRRARWKTKQLERDFEQLKALYDDLVTSHDSLVVDHDSLIVDNQRLRSEVMSLTEKLQAKTTTGYPNHQQHQPPVDDSDVLKPIISPFSPSDPVEPKTEDHLSSGSHISAVVDEEHPSQLVVDSDDSYYPEPEDGSFHGGCGYMVHSEEEDGSDNSGAYYSSGMFANVDAVMEQQQQLEAEVGAGVMGWWAWS